MHRSIVFWLRVSICLLVFLGYLGLMTTYRYGPSIMLVALTAVFLMPVGEWLDRRSSSFRTITSAVSFIYVVTLPLIISVVDLLDAVTALVVYIQIHSMIHVKKQRNYDHIVLMSFFLLLAASVMTPSPTIGMVFILFVITAVWTLVLLEMFSAAQGSQGSPSADLREGSEGLPMSLERPKRLLDIRLTGMVAIASAAVVALTGVLFFSSPRLEAGLFGTESGDMFRTGLDPGVDLADGGTITTDTTAIMRVTFPKEEDTRFEEEMYWRVTALDHYTGSSWMRRGLTTRSRPYNTPLDFLRYSSRFAWDVSGGVFRMENGQGRIVEQEIYLDVAPEQGMPGLSLLQSMQLKDGQKGVKLRWSGHHDFTVELSQRNEPGLNYTVWSEIYNPSPDELRRASDEYIDTLNKRDFLNLTAHNLLPETLEVVKEITAGLDNAYDKATAIQTFLAGNGYKYTLEIPDLPNENPIDAFIMQTRTGHCQLYASALALMMRSEGIPTRVVKGYRGGTWDAKDKAYTVSADMAHLWVEGFFPGHGWIVFDPSPPSLEFSPFTIGALQRSLSFLALKWKMLWYQNVVGFAPENRIEMLRDATIGLFRVKEREGASNAASAKINFFEHILGLLPPAAVLAGGLFFVFIVIRTARRRTRAAGLSLTHEQFMAIRLHRELGRKLRRQGIEWQGKSVGELRSAVRDLDWDESEIVSRLLEAYSAVRFGQRSLPASLFGRLRRMTRRLRTT